MISSRFLARSAPRAISRLTCSALRRPATLSPYLLQSTCTSAKLPMRAAFSSTSMFRKERAGENDEELIAKFSSELSLEQEMREQHSMPQSVKDYMDNGPFEVIDKDGEEEVILTRNFGNENIRISFSVADLNSPDPEADYQDRAMQDEEDEMDSENINQGSKGFKVAPEDSVSAANAEEGGEGEDNQSFPAQLNIVIEKPGKGALTVEATAQDGMIIIDNVYHYQDSTHAVAQTAEKAHQREDLYAGPPFSNLDEELQVLLEKYLKERGVNDVLASFVPDYIDYKEQKEYEKWLENVKGFLEA